MHRWIVTIIIVTAVALASAVLAVDTAARAAPWGSGLFMSSGKIPPPTIAGISPATCSFTQGSAGSCNLTITMSPLTPTFAARGGTLSLVSANSACPGSNDTSNFSTSNSPYVLTYNGTAAAGSYKACVQASASGIANAYQQIAVTVTTGVVALVFNKGGDRLDTGSSPYTVSYGLGTGSKLLIAFLEFANCTSPSITYGGVAMINPPNAITTVAQGGNNPVAGFYLINPPTSGNFVVTCPGANFLYLIATDYTDTNGVPVFVSAGNSVDPVVEVTYTDSYTNPSANNLIIMGAGNIGNSAAGPVAGGTGAVLRQGNKYSSDGLFDSGGAVAAGPWSMTASVQDSSSGGPFSNSKQSRVYMAFNAGGPPPPPTIGTVSLATPNFVVPAAAGSQISVINNTCPNQGCSTITHTLVQTGGVCNATNGADNALFAISGTNLKVGGTAISTARSYAICDRADLAGATDTPVFTALTPTGATVIPVAITLTPPSPVSIVDTAANAALITTPTTSTSNGSTFSGTYSYSGDALMKMSGSGPTATVITSRALVSGDDGSHAGTIQACENGSCVPKSISITVSPASTVSLDSTIFTQTQPDTPNGGDTIVANITGCTGPSDCHFTGGADDAKFKVVAPGDGLSGGVCTNPITPGCPAGWINGANGGPRKGPFLMSNGTQSGQQNGYNVQLNGTNFHLTDPPAPSVSGAVIVNSGGNIQNAINGASAGQAIFLRCGTYGGFSSTNGHNIVSATTQNHINGETCRAVVSGVAANISGSTIYGVDFETCSADPCLSGGDYTLTNIIVDRHQNTAMWFCEDQNVTVTWSTFRNAHGYNGSCGAGNGNFTFRHNFVYQCNGDCDPSPPYFDPSGVVTESDNFYDINNINDQPNAANELQAAIEWGCKTTCIANNNYVLNAGGGGPVCCGGYAWSLIAEGTIEFHYNYTAGHDTATEISTHINLDPASRAYATDNYLDWQNIQNIGQYSNQGIFDTGDPCPENNSLSAVRNNEIPNISDRCLAPYTPGNTINVGIPAPFATGAGP